MIVEMKTLSSLSKVRYGGDAAENKERLSGFQNETISFQVAYRLMEGGQMQVKAEALSPIAGHVRVRQVAHVPVSLAAYPDADEDYISHAPGLYPDLLRDVARDGEPVRLWAYSDRWQILWVDVEADENLRPGVYPVRVALRSEDGQEVGRAGREVEILRGVLPRQELLHTQWFHCDCLAQYYHVPVFSEEHWKIIERFAACAIKRGVNVLLMPIHTPPLDTRVGGERLTVQLVDITEKDGQYVFDMAKVRRWIAMCRHLGFERYEAAHLFTQWGARHAPKIMGWSGGEYKRLFGWETDAASKEYRAFLRSYIPALRQVFREEGMEEQVIWHISDEPGGANLESYLAARRQVDELLQGCRVMDALSDFAFYERGVVRHPIVSSDHIEPFAKAGALRLWAYYCCAQHREVSNRFIAMPSWRNRALGVQLYLYRIEGFLQWGFNFYNTQYSDRAIDPYATTDADGWVPAGDPFAVYPGENGVPEESVRLMVFAQALDDLRALGWLEEMAGRDFVCGLIEKMGGGEITFKRYPREEAFYLRLRQKVNEEIALRLA